MIHYNNLYITEDSKYLVIDVAIDEDSTYDDVYLDRIAIDTQDTYITNGPSNNAKIFHIEDQENFIIPFFNKLGIYPKLQIERKKDGRIFWYLRIGKFSGADKISAILEEFPIQCYSYKRWSSETIQKWSKFQEKLKSTDIDFNSLSSQAKTALFKKLSI